MIYGRFGDQVELVRWATLDDVKKLEGRKPDKQDHEALKNGCYIVVRHLEDDSEALYHQAFLKADGGCQEIAMARDALPVVKQ